MKIKRIEHVGIVVKNVEASRKLWEDCFGIPLGSVEQFAERPVKLALYPVGESMVELISGLFGGVFFGSTIRLVALP